MHKSFRHTLNKEKIMGVCYVLQLISMKLMYRKFVITNLYYEVVSSLQLTVNLASKK